MRPFLLHHADLKMCRLYRRCDQSVQSPYLLDVTPCRWLICYRPFGINFQKHLRGAKYFLLFRFLNVRQLSCVETSTTDYHFVRRRKTQQLIVRRRRFYCGKSKSVICSASLCLVLTALQIHSDTLCLYCNVNRQVMELDRVSVFC